MLRANDANGQDSPSPLSPRQLDEQDGPDLEAALSWFSSCYHRLRGAKKSSHPGHVRYVHTGSQVLCSGGQELRITNSPSVFRVKDAGEYYGLVVSVSRAEYPPSESVVLCAPARSLDLSFRRTGAMVACRWIVIHADMLASRGIAMAARMRSRPSSEETILTRV